MRKLLRLTGLLALAAATPACATTYLMDWSATGTGYRYSGPGAYAENITVAEAGQGYFTIDDSKLGGSFHDYLTDFSLVSHVVETDHETAPGFDFSYSDIGDVKLDLLSIGIFSFTIDSGGQPDFLSFAAGGLQGDPAFVHEVITGTNNVFSSVVAPQGVTTVGKLTVTQAVPEPLSWILMLVGFGVVGTALRRRSAPDFA